MRLFEVGDLRIAFRLADHVNPVRVLLAKYRDTPMSLADACLVRMAEIHEEFGVLTLASDFLVYRKHGKGQIDAILP